MRRILLLSSIPFFGTLLIVSSCDSDRNHEEGLVNRIEELEKELEDVYRPGYGSLMMNIRQHHSNLWYAAINENWDLAAFELEELEERFEELEKFQAAEEASKLIPTVWPEIEGLEELVAEGNSEDFGLAYDGLSLTCNKCHQATGHDFIKIIRPEGKPGLRNQSFEK